MAIQWYNPITRAPFKQQAWFSVLVNLYRQNNGTVKAYPRNIVQATFGNNLEEIQQGFPPAVKGYQNIGNYTGIVTGLIEYNLFLEEKAISKTRAVQSIQTVDKNKYIADFYGLTINGLVPLNFNFSKAILQARQDFQFLPKVRFYSNAEILSMDVLQLLELYYNLRTYVTSKEEPGLKFFDRCSALKPTNASHGIPIEYISGTGKMFSDYCRQWNELLLQNRIYQLRQDLRKVYNATGQQIDGLVYMGDKDFRGSCPKEQDEIIAEAVASAIVGVLTMGIGTAVTVAKYAIEAAQLAQQIAKTLELKSQAKKLQQKIDAAKAGAASIISSQEILDTFGLSNKILPYESVKNLPTSNEAMMLANKLGLEHPSQIVPRNENQVVYLQKIWDKVFLKRLLLQQVKLEQSGIDAGIFMVPYRYPETGVIGGMIVLHRDEMTSELKTIPIKEGVIPMKGNQFLNNRQIVNAIPDKVPASKNKPTAIPNNIWSYRFQSACIRKQRFNTAGLKFHADRYWTQSPAVAQSSKMLWKQPYILDEISIPGNELGVSAGKTFVNWPADITGQKNPIQSPSIPVAQSFKKFAGIVEQPFNNVSPVNNNPQRTITPVIHKPENDDSSIWFWILLGASIL